MQRRRHQDRSSEADSWAAAAASRPNSGCGQQRLTSMSARAGMPAWSGDTTVGGEQVLGPRARRQNLGFTAERLRTVIPEELRHLCKHHGLVATGSTSELRCVDIDTCAADSACFCFCLRVGGLRLVACG